MKWNAYQSSISFVNVECVGCTCICVCVYCKYMCLVYLLLSFVQCLLVCGFFLHFIFVASKLCTSLTHMWYYYMAYNKYVIYSLRHPNRIHFISFYVSLHFYNIAYTCHTYISIYIYLSVCLDEKKKNFLFYFDRNEIVAKVSRCTGIALYPVL